MRASVIIPVWNGADVILACLEALYINNPDPELGEVICVDNASQDNSAELIASHYPQVRLLREPVNLGFAGGVNAGIEVAQGDIFILLNQDSLTQPGCVVALVRALKENPRFGIAGGTILNPDGTINHTGALIRRPDAYGVHLSENQGSGLRTVDYVTGALFALRRDVWNLVGRFDEGFYPAYYEESDYCYRARRKGIETVYVPQARVIHLFTGQDWKIDPIKHTANHHLSRYRFVIKHFNNREVKEFFEAEYVALEAESYFEQAVGRVIAARDILRSLPDILERRRVDLGEAPSPVYRRQLQVGFTRILRQAFAIAEKLAPPQGIKPTFRMSGEHEITPAEKRPPSPAVSPVSQVIKDWESTTQKLQSLQRREYDLLTRIYFKPPSADRSEPLIKRMFRLLVLRPLSFIIGRDYLLLSELNTVHVARMDQINLRLDQIMKWVRYVEECLDKRLTLLETLADYDYR